MGSTNPPAATSARVHCPSPHQFSSNLHHKEAQLQHSPSSNLQNYSKISFSLIFVVPHTHGSVQGACGYDGFPDADIHTSDLTAMEREAQEVKRSTTRVLRERKNKNILCSNAPPLTWLPHGHISLAASPLRKETTLRPFFLPFPPLITGSC